jgi:hypothetical protein
MRALYRVLKILAFALATLVVGFLIGRARGSDNVPDGAPAAVGHELHATARQICLGFPGARFLIPATRLKSVTNDPAHCPGTGTNPNLHYRATVQRYTLFGIPAGQYEVRCGGLEVACR